MGNSFQTTEASDGNDTLDISQEVLRPRNIQNDEGSITERSIDELIKAEQHIASKEATTASKGFGIRFGMFKPGGTV